MCASLVGAIERPGLHVLLSHPRGELVLYDLTLESTVDELKHRIAERLRVPALCQKLYFGISVLNDPEAHLRDLDPRDAATWDYTAAIPMRMAVSMEYVNRICQDRTSTGPERLEAVEAISLASEEGSDRAIAVLLSRFEDCDVDVRQAAARALAQVAREGDETVIGELLKRLELNEDARWAAVDALSRIARRGDADTVGALLGKLQHRSEHVRCAALEALSGVARRGDADVVAAVTARLRSEELSVRWAAASAVPRVADADDEDAAAALVACLGDPKESVRQTAVESLLRMARTKRTVSSLRPLLEAPEAFVRRHALDALSGFVDEGDEGFISAAITRLEDGDECVRYAAVRALSQVAKKGDHRVVADVRARLEARNGFVKQAAVEALLHVMEEDSPHIESTLAVQLSHCDQCTRIKAEHAAQHVEGKGLSTTMKSVTHAPAGTAVTHLATRKHFEVAAAFHRDPVARPGL